MERYDDFIMLKQPVKFNEKFSGQNIERVQVHVDEFGFCGAFSWKDDKITALDGDSYNEAMTVYKYRMWDDGVLDVVVGNNW